MNQTNDLDWSFPDPIYEGFLRDAHRTSQALFDASDLVAGEWLTPQHLVLHLSCHGLVKTPEGRIQVHAESAVGLHLPSNFLSWVDPMSVVTVLAPHGSFHPNVRAPVACIGPIEPGELIDSLIYRVFDLVSYNNFTTDERDALSFEACQFARSRIELFPVDGRPLLWRKGDPVPELPDAAARARAWGSA